MDPKEHYPNQFAKPDLFEATDEELALCSMVNNQSVQWLVVNQHQLRSNAIKATVSAEIITARAKQDQKK